MSAQGLGYKGPITRSSSTQAPLPSGSNTGDILYWDATEEKWLVLAAPSATGTFVLGSVDGELTWLATAGCA